MGLGDVTLREDRGNKHITNQWWLSLLSVGLSKGETSWGFDAPKLCIDGNISTRSPSASIWLRV